MSLCDRDDCTRFRRAMRNEQEMRRKAQERAERAEKALARLASTEAFTVALDLDHSPPLVLADELRARGEFARAAIEPSAAKETT